MRLIFGMILGAAVTIGGAYVADTSKTGTDGRMTIVAMPLSEPSDLDIQRAGIGVL